MPSFKTTIEDTSPMIMYSSGWRAGLSTDVLANKYSQSSFMVTSTKKETAQFVFNGTGVNIFGAKRLNHGSYETQLDDGMRIPGNGTEANPGSFQVSLFSAVGLAQGLHTVVLTNMEDKFLDIDFITWDTTIGTNANDKLYVDTFQDTSPSFTYLPTEADWEVPPRNIGGFMGGSGHATTKFGASMIYTFDVRDGVSLYGPVGPDGSSYSVQVDGGTPMGFNARKEFDVPQSLLYHASSLGSGIHNLTLVYQQNPQQQTLAVDYAAVFATTPSRPVETGPTKNAPDPSSSNGGKLASQPTGVIVGLAVAVAILLTISSIMSILYWRLRRAHEQQNKPTSDTEFFRSGVAAPNIQTNQPSLPRESRLFSHYHEYGYHKSAREGSTYATRSEVSNDGSLSQSPSDIVHTVPHTEDPPIYSMQ